MLLTYFYLESIALHLGVILSEVSLDPYDFFVKGTPIQQNEKDSELRFYTKYKQNQLLALKNWVNLYSTPVQLLLCKIWCVEKCV